MIEYQLLYIEGTGHFPMLEKPDEFNMLLEKALNSIESKSNKNIYGDRENPHGSPLPQHRSYGSVSGGSAG